MIGLDAAQRAALQQVAVVLGDTPWVLIGATALACQIDMDWRRTDDIDVVVAVALDDLPGTLSRLPGWQRDPRREHRWKSVDGTRLDVLPASEDLLASGKLEWSDGAVMNLVGLDLAFAHHVERSLGRGQRLRLATVPAIAVLKIVAYLDRPAERERDLEDLSRLLRCYLADDDERRFDEPLVHLHHDEQAAYALGWDVAQIANEEHRECVSRFLARLAPESVDLSRAAALAGHRLDRDAEERRFGTFAGFGMACGRGPVP